ncbi:MAG TPA: hypothetical protein DD416_05730 [Rhodobacteraceae bacterium]|nr:hypothetical protein [Paracoccaceae bacterium]
MAPMDIVWLVVMGLVFAVWAAFRRRYLEYQASETPIIPPAPKTVANATIFDINVPNAESDNH